MHHLTARLVRFGGRDGKSSSGRQVLPHKTGSCSKVPQPFLVECTQRLKDGHPSRCWKEENLLVLSGLRVAHFKQWSGQRAEYDDIGRRLLGWLTSGVAGSSLGDGCKPSEEPGQRCKGAGEKLGGKPSGEYSNSILGYVVTQRFEALCL